MKYYLIILFVVVLIFIIYKNKREYFIPDLVKEDINNYTGTILYNNKEFNKNKNKYIDLDHHNRIKLLDKKNVLFVDRYKDINCKNNEYRYCYNGDLKIVDMFDNVLYKKNEDSSYNYGASYDSLNSKMVNLKDYDIPVSNNNQLVGSSITREEVSYDTTNCDVNKPWRFLNHCYPNEAEASYFHDKKYYDEKNYEKYPFDKKPINPNKTSINYSGDNYKVIYEKEIWDLHNRPIRSVEYNLEKCNREKPFFWENKCYDNIFVNSTCKISNNEKEKNVSCLDLKYLGKENLYNNITNNFIGDLKYGDYAHFICDNSGELTECITQDKIKKNENYISIENTETKTYDHILNNNVLYNDENKKSTFVKEHYIETNPHSFYENYNKDFINGYNENILPNETSFFIECKTNYKEGGDGDFQCPKNLPICEGNINNIQPGVCKEDMKIIEKIGYNNEYYMNCDSDKDCPYHFPLCKENICTHNTIKKRPNSTGVLNDKFNFTI